jgi:peptidoglycan hydrolase-like protein with peptidoglycan-binding domain
MNLPFIKLVVPTALKQFKNGQLADSVLASIKTGGKMYAPVAAEFNKLYDAALAAGIKLKNVGDYRSFQGQLSMFMDRYVTTDTGTGVTRQYEGKTWWLKKGKAPSAAPDPTGLKGSNHGWGLAIDLGYDQGGKTASFGLNVPAFQWMCANAPKYGFYLQGNNPASKEFEAWHWQYCLGDAAPDGSVQAAPAVAPAAPAPAGGGMKFDYPGTPVALGSKGPSAALVQAIIGAKADGDFGPKSVASLKAWQTANGLTADGSVGPVTWKKMFG